VAFSLLLSLAVIVPEDIGMHENRDRMVEDLSERFRTALESGDPTELLDATTLLAARNLAQALLHDSRDAGAADVIETLSVLVAGHWAGDC
jgi:hypothetical protein